MMLMNSMLPVLSRRAFLTTAAILAGILAALQSADADAPPVAPAEPEPAAVPVSAPTPEGKALAEAAIASAGHSLTAEDKLEVETQLSSYPSSNGDLRRFPVANGIAPSMSVTPSLPGRKS